MNLHLSPRKQFLKELYCIWLPGAPNLFGVTNSVFHTFTKEQEASEDTRKQPHAGSIGEEPEEHRCKTNTILN